MTITAKDYALLSSDTYNDRPNDQKVILGGVAYKVFDHYSDSVTGHSLGGAITEILAYEMHWHGITFNGPLRQGIKS